MQRLLHPDHFDIDHFTVRRAPELTVEQLTGEFYSKVARCYGDSRARVGAYIVRQGGVQVVEHMQTGLDAAYGGRQPRAPYSFKGTAQLDRGLHSDSGTINDTTVQEMKKGKAMFLVVQDSALEVHDHTIAKKMIYAALPPDVPVFQNGEEIDLLVAQLNPGDVTLFSHTDNHDFTTISPYRHSESYYFKPLEELRNPPQ